VRTLDLHADLFPSLAGVLGPYREPKTLVVRFSDDPWLEGFGEAILAEQEHRAWLQRRGPRGATALWPGTSDYENEQQ
jgi:hypothetical protein